MKGSQTRSVTLDLASRFDLIEMVHTVLSHFANLAGFDEDQAHYMSVAVRESVANAIMHGNREDESKRVHVVFALGARALMVSVRDEGPGFDPRKVRDPRDDENLMKADGRGIFFMRQFMDRISYGFPPGGGTVVRLVKRLPATSTPS